MNGLATNGLITMDEACCIESTEAGRLMSVFYLDLETMKHIMKINGEETLERLLWIICESHELADMHLRVDERRCLNALNRNNAAATIRFPMKGKITTRQMKLNCIIQATLGCLNIPDPSLNQEAMKIMRIADRICKCLVAYVTRPALTTQQPKYYSAVLNSLLLAKCVAAHLWENSQFVSKQLKGIGPTFSTLLTSAGKVNFMLLEESHPRDLERIMNKGPPAGNVLRKQISLLPKYQVTMTPVDEKSVTIQLVLLNQNHLSEYIEQLTAGDSHKSYVVVGDSENNLLQLTSFKDKDLISVYDGMITHQIIRKHSFEHKMFAHCISSSFVGIDAHCEYTFKDLETAYSSPHVTINETIPSKPISSKATDIFKERKRVNTFANDITQSKQKKKRDNDLLEKLKTLKASFGKTSMKQKRDLEQSATMSNKILQDLTQLEKRTEHNSSEIEQASEQFSTCQLTTNVSATGPTNLLRKNFTNSFRTEPRDVNENQSSSKTYINNFDSDDFIDEEKINNILNEIENEISRGSNKGSDLPQVDLSSRKNSQHLQNSFTLSTESSLTKESDLPFDGFGFKTNTLNVQTSHNIKSSSTNVSTINNDEKNQNYKIQATTKKKLQKKYKPKNNYNFIDLLDNTTKMCAEDDVVINNTSGFVNTIKSQVDKYLLQTKHISSDQPFAGVFSVSEKKDDEEETSKCNFVEPEENIKIDNINLTKNCQNNNGIQVNDSINYKELRGLEENKPELGGNTETLKHGIESDVFENNHIVTEVDVVSNSCNKEKSSRFVNFLSQTAIPLQTIKSYNDTEQNQVKITMSFDNNNETDASISHHVPNVLELPSCPIVHLPSTLCYHQMFPVISPQTNNQTINEKTEISAEVKFGNIKHNESEIALVNRSESKQYDVRFLDSQTHRRTIFQNKPIPPEVIEDVKRRLPEIDRFENSNADFNHISQFRLQTTPQNNTMSSGGTIVNVKRKRSEIYPVETLKPEPNILPVTENSQISTQIICQNNHANAEGTIMNMKQRCQYKPNDTIQTPELTTKTYENYHFIKNHQMSKRNENTRNYSYWATKIDIATKENDTIIRKIEMNLNITETIARKNRDYNSDHNTIINNNIDIGPCNTKNKHSVNFQIPEIVKKVEENQLAEISINIHDARTNKKDELQNFTGITKTGYINLKTVDEQQTSTAIMPVLQATKKSKRQNYTPSPEKKRIDIETFQTTRNNNNVMLSMSQQYEESSRKDESKYCTENSETKNEFNKNIGESFSEPNNKLTILPSPTVTSYTSDTEFQRKQSIQKVSNTLSATIVDNKSSSSTKCLQKKGKIMESIFQKYCAIMSNDTTENLSQTTTQPKINNNNNNNNAMNTQSKKPKRPFKISDIPSLKTSLPKLMITTTGRCNDLDETAREPSKTPNLDEVQSHIYQNIRNTHLKLQSLKENLRPEPRSTEICENFSQIINYAETNNLNLPYNMEQGLSQFIINDNAIEALNPQQSDTDFNIDQTMFNPKNLLQCFGNDETDIIVPPPPQFCDKSGVMLQAYDDNLPLHCYEPMHWENYDLKATEESIIQDDSNIELTPTNEIETWTFSQHDERYRELSTCASVNSRQCFTMMHTPSQRRNQFQNVSVARRNELGQFKFCRKRKLRPKP